jgi:hypothetical protein
MAKNCCALTEIKFQHFELWTRWNSASIADRIKCLWQMKNAEIAIKHITRQENRQSNQLQYLVAKSGSMQEWETIVFGGIGRNVPANTILLQKIYSKL